MFKNLEQRAVELELMDKFPSGGAELRKAYRQLRLLNRIFGAAGPTRYGVERLWTEAKEPKQLTIVDIGSGSGDVNRQLLRWAAKRGIQLQLILADVTEEACSEAERLYHDEHRVKVIQCNLFDLPAGCADIVTGTQFVHHFSADELPAVVVQMVNCSRLGVVINDIHRHRIAWAAVWLMTRIMSDNRYIRNDGPLSVAKGFRSSDWDELGRQLGIAGPFYRWRPLFRYAVTIRKMELSGW